MLKTSILLLTLATVSLSTTPNNDSAVQIMSDNNIYIPENTKIVGNIKVDNNNHIKYSLTDSADKNLFNIDNNTGTLSFKINPDFEAPNDADKQNQYNVTVMIDNNKGMSDKKDFVVTVLDIVEL